MIHRLVVFGCLLVVTVQGGCLLKQDTKHASLCVIEENPADETFLQNLCSDESVSGDLSIVGEYKSGFESFRTLGSYCRYGVIGRLHWVKYSRVSERLLNSKSVNVELPRVARVLDANDESKLTHDYAGDDVEILVEKLPLRYELKSIERTKWKNVTEVQGVMLSREYLKNPDKKSVVITREVPYTSNTTTEHVFPANIVKNREVRIFNKGDKITRVNSFAKPLSSLEHKSFKIERRVGPQSSLELRVVGTLANVWYELTGDLNLIYDDEVRESRKVRVKVIETTLVDVHAEEPIFTRMDGQRSDEFLPEHDGGAADLGNWFTVACVIFFGTVVIAVIDVSRRLILGKQAKAKLSGKENGF